MSDTTKQRAARAIQRAWQASPTRCARAYLAASARIAASQEYAEALRATQTEGETVGACVRGLFRAYADRRALPPPASRAVASAHLFANHHALLFAAMLHVEPALCDALHGASVRLLACLDAVCRALCASREALPHSTALPQRCVAFLEVFKAWQRIDLERMHRNLLAMLTHLHENEAPLLHPAELRPIKTAQRTLVRQRMGELMGERALEAYDDEHWHARAFPGKPLPLDALSDARLRHEMRVAPRFATALCHSEAYRTRAYWSALADDLRRPHERGLARLRAALALVRPSLPPGCMPITLGEEARLPTPREAMDAFRRAYVALNRDNDEGRLHDDEREAWQALAARYRAPLDPDAFPAWLADGLEMLAHRAATRRARAVMRRRTAAALSAPLPSAASPVLERLLLLPPRADDADADRLAALRIDLDALAAVAGGGREAVVVALRLLAQTQTEAPAAPLQSGTPMARLRGLWQRMQRMEEKEAPLV
jgi:hypothetical protein